MKTPRNEWLYIGDLAFEANEEDLHSLFETVGKTVEVEVVRDQETQHSKGIAFVHMNDAATARKAADTLNGQSIKERPIYVITLEDADKERAQGFQ